MLLSYSCKFVLIRGQSLCNALPGLTTTNVHEFTRIVAEGPEIEASSKRPADLFVKILVDSWSIALQRVAGAHNHEWVRIYTNSRRRTEIEMSSKRFAVLFV